MFPPSETDTAIEILEVECGERLPFSGTLGTAGVERIRAAVVKLSGGSLDRLRDAVRIAQTDWRDALMAAGFGHDVNAHHSWLDG